MYQLFILSALMLLTSCSTGSRARSKSQSKIVYWAKSSSVCMKSDLRTLGKYFRNFGDFEIDRVLDEKTIAEIDYLATLSPKLENVIDPNSMLKIVFYNQTPTQFIYTDKSTCESTLKELKMYRSSL